jgi:hypothetical protein
VSGNIRYVTRHGRRIAVETLNPDPPTKIRRRREDAFVQVPLAVATRAAAAMKSPKMMIWLYLLYRAWQTKSTTVTVSTDALIAYGVNRRTKSRALRQLEVAGLITIKRASRRTPVVTLIC